MENNPYRVIGMKECILVSLVEIKAEMTAKLEEYWGTVGFSNMLGANNAGGFLSIVVKSPQIVDQVINALLAELFMEKQSDMRNAGRLEITEQVLIDHAHVDERTAHQMAEDLFAQLVNYLGMHIPSMTFSNHEGYKFKIMRHDLLIYRD